MGKNRTETAAPAQAGAEGPSKPEILDPAAVDAAVSEGAKVLADGGTKADAARAIYGLINNEAKETIVAAFVKGATLTEKGALTYWYNCRRKAGKAQKAAEQQDK